AGDLGAIDRYEESIRIGAAVSLSDAFAALEPEFPEFAEMFRRFASVPVRNAGTLVGNIANGSPIGDSMPALLCLDTEIVLQGGNATRTLPLHEFYLGYQQTALARGEFVKAVRIPRRRAGMALASYKISKRFDQDISALCGAFAVMLEGATVKDCRIAFGGMAAIPRRAAAAEAALTGATWSEAAIAAAAAALANDFAPLSDMRASADYRRQVAANLLLKFHAEYAGHEAARVFELTA
ncbi:MAG: FAD binding domain-containing protein, partial [Gammaproteobacteria bacterium]|nr:FAD binding domain-containing protein [Gammaproteobacteria bacterium]